ncbi:SpoIIAA family protein [Salinimicrobium oceani]|uniref:STAS/SEC14 domain-containing protein n=1 Tax=Salinimicrobium oceani TaxID=2722702 RepID=A0ABX1CWM0_9FLAO|nr:STAS/SEC14 domain-containing protein [Salinimicrobium oceani]NJW52690.1 STAS/SEC14 domain-containing protein [Salinimicrobium oceani]
MLKLLNSNNKELIAAKICDKVSKEDVENVHLLIHQILSKSEKVNFYLELQDFHGYEWEGLLADLKVESAHLSNYGNMAIVGDKKWKKWAAKATDLFTASEVKYFDLDEKKAAKEWIGF